MRSGEPSQLAASTAGKNTVLVNGVIVCERLLSGNCFLAKVAGAAAQPPRIGVSQTSRGPKSMHLNGASAMRVRQGQSIIFETRYAEGNLDLPSDLAVELVQLKGQLDCFHRAGDALRSEKYQENIPIVMGYSGDPVDAGIVASLPGGTT